MTPILSIVIPTHNRAQYAYHSILSILSIINSDIELVISDTSTNNELYEKLADQSNPLINNPFLKYFRPTAKLDMTGNHNYVIEKAVGEYICLIGDDDTITKDLIDAVKWQKENNIDVISPNILSNYAWPDFRSLYFGYGHARRLYIPRKLGNILLINSSKAVSEALHNAAQGTDGLPKIYHGIVKRELINELISKSGKLFHGSSPDVSGAIALSLVTKQFVTIDYPLTIPGASGASNTGRSAINQHVGKIEDEKQTSFFQQSGWSSGVPKFFSVETVWAHAAIETIKSLHKDHLLIDFNFHYLLAICKLKYPKYKYLTEIAVKEAALILDEDILLFRRKMRTEIFRYYNDRVRHIFKRMLRPPTAAGGRLNISGIDNIAKAQIVFTKYMQKRNWSWSLYIKRNSIKTL